MKKIIAMLLTAAMALSAVACGGGADPAETGEDSGSRAAETGQETSGGTEERHSRGPRGRPEMLRRRKRAESLRSA